MITRVTEGTRREGHEPPSFLASRGFAAQRSLARACTPLTKSEEKETLLAVYSPRSEDEMRHCWANNVDRCCVRSHVAERLTARFKLCATTPNNTQQGVQTDACNHQTVLRTLARGFKGNGAFGATIFGIVWVDKR